MGLRPSLGVSVFGTGTLDPAHPEFRQYVDFAPGADRLEQVQHFGRPVKRRTLTRQGESDASIRFIARAWNRWVTAARRFEPYWVCACRRTRPVVRWECEPHESRHDKSRCRRSVEHVAAIRHERGCRDRYRPAGEAAFFKGLELQRNGRAHVHFLLRVGDLEGVMASQQGLRELAIRAGFGGSRKWRDSRGRLRSGFEIERIRSRQDVAGYVSKVAGSGFAGVSGEVAKDSQSRTLPAGSRRASWSMGRRAWAPGWVESRRTDLDWRFARAGAVTVTRALRASGIHVDPAMLVRTGLPAVRAGERLVAV